MTAWSELGEEERRLFIAESEELVDTLESGLLALERGEVDAGLVDEIFRAAHTLKGSAATAGLEGMAGLTHAMENLLDEVRAGRRSPGSGEVELLLRAVDFLRETLAAVAAGEHPPEPPEALYAALDAAVAGGETAAAVPASTVAGTTPDTGATSDTGAGSTGNGRTASAPQSQPAARADWRVEAQLDPECPMPAVRALQVLLALEPLGEVVASDPSREAIEAEWSGRVVRVWLRGGDREAVGAALRSIPDLTRVRVEPAAPPSPQRQARSAEDRTIRVDVDLLDRLLNLVGELVIDRGRLARVGQRLAERNGAQDLAEELSRVTAHLGRVTGALQEVVLKTRMLPVAYVFRRFPRLVRDLAAQLGKEVELEVSGEDTELDRSLLDVIADPLLHLVRNALDHGIEPPEERLRLGKPRVGRLLLSASQEGHHVLIRLEDDGRGIDPDRVRATAVRKGLLSPERAAALGDREVLDLLFAPGFSTASNVTDVSGRGVGLDVVRKNVEGAGGRVEIESTPGRGTAFVLVLPLTLATLRALLVRVDRDVYAIPLASVAEVLQVEPAGVTSLQGRWATTVRGRVVPLFWLRQYAEPGFRPGRPARPVLAVLVHHQGRWVGLVVDRLLGEQEVVVKGLGRLLAGVRGLSGVTILGDGSLALILDVPALIACLAADAARDAARNPSDASRDPGPASSRDRGSPAETGPAGGEPTPPRETAATA
ncbi:MAG TPA: chemotaxis protein CheA [Thermaerobacter sp.]